MQYALLFDIQSVDQKKNWTALHKHYTIYVLEWPSKSRINNYIKPHRVQYILRNFYYTTMQKLCKFEALHKMVIRKITNF